MKHHAFSTVMHVLDDDLVSMGSDDTNKDDDKMIHVVIYLADHHECVCQSYSSTNM